VPGTYPHLPEHTFNATVDQESGVFRGRRSEPSPDRNSMVWKTRALCATLRPQ